MKNEKVKLSDNINTLLLYHLKREGSSFLISCIKTVLVFVLLLSAIFSHAQGISPETAAKIDTLVAQNYNLGEIVEFGQTHIFFTISGTRYDIPMAVATVNDTISGGIFSGYAIQENITPAQQAVLNDDSLPNTCISILALSMDSITYDSTARKHWENCGFILTSSTPPVFTKNNIVTVYPVPFDNVLIINTKENILTLRIYDLYGQRVYQYNTTIGANNTLFLQPGLVKGIYLLTVTTEKSKTITVQIIKR